MEYPLRKFIDKWIEEGRFPREEMRIRWWIAVPGLVVALTLVVALIAAGLG